MTNSEARSSNSVGRVCSFDIRIPGFFRVWDFVIRHFRLIRQLHYVIEITGLIVATELEDIDEAIMRPGKRLKFLQPAELALEMFVAVEALALDDFDGAQSADCAFRQPHVAVASTANATEHFVVGNGRGPSTIPVM